MLLSLIVAVAQSGVIGREGALPWRLPADLRRFKAVTMGKPIIMGRRTWQSIGRPLPGRLNIVLTRDRTWTAEGAVVAHSSEDALQAAGSADEVIVIGGAEIYRLFLPRARRIYLTEVKTDVPGDTAFPAFDRTAWHEVQREEHPADDKNAYAYSFVVLERAKFG